MLFARVKRAWFHADSATGDPGTIQLMSLVSKVMDAGVYDSGPLWAQMLGQHETQCAFLCVCGAEGGACVCWHLTYPI